MWLCIHLPRLLLDISTRGNITDEPLAVCDGRGTRRRIVARNDTAADAGVHVGMTLSAAQALTPTLRVIQRHHALEQQALELLATWSLQFTPLVSLAPPLSLLLEIGRSATLFGGLPALQQRIEQGVRELGYMPRLSIAPTPLAALFFARAGLSGSHTKTNWREKLLQQPLHVLDATASTLQALDKLGLRSLGACQKLPRADIAKRFAVSLLQQLDRALGIAPDARAPFTPAQQFSGRIVLLASASQLDILLLPIHRLLLELASFLQIKQQAVSSFTCHFEHEDHIETVITIGLRQSSRHWPHWMAVIREQLQRTPLPASVTAIAVSATQFSPLAPQTAQLFVDTADAAQQDHVFIERLQARLGEDAVQGLHCIGEHRPEQAWRYGALEASLAASPPGATTVTALPQDRPLWLLPQPIMLNPAQQQPCFHGRLTLRQGPERIESGWWDGSDVARDYFIAHSPAGEQLWIYRDASGQGHWHLHGIFS
jgi:protein ImuB